MSIPSPYNFVPLSSKIIFPNWSKQVSHDIPFEDGLSGEIEVKLTTRTPIYIRNQGHYPDNTITRNNDLNYSSFFKIGDKYYIPGSSFKGALRNIVEIISFSRISVEDQTFSRNKMPYKNSVLTLIKNLQKDFIKTDTDFAQTIFGAITEKEAIKGRVHVSSLIGNVVKIGFPKKFILGGPKASYFPTYLEQKEGSIKTYDDDSSHIRGWKRYPVRKDGFNPQDMPSKLKDKSKVFTVFTPLLQDSIFEGKIRFFNLKPTELGALLWALTWGGDQNKRHSIGMGKPLGFGSVACETNKLKITANNGRIINESAEDWIKIFKQFRISSGIEPTDISNMEKELLSMADPEYISATNLVYPDLNETPKPLKEYKKKDKEDFLHPYSEKIPPHVYSNRNIVEVKVISEKIPPYSNGDIVEVKVISEKTKKGDHKFQVELDERTIGCLHPQSKKPIDLEIGYKYTMIMKSFSPGNCSYEYIPEGKK